MITAPQLKKVLPFEDIVKKRDGSGHFIIRRGYFMKHSLQIDYFIECVISRVHELGLGITVLDSGSKWSNLHCGPIKEHSHMWVVVDITGEL